MPRYDGSGPWGQGPMTGRGMGPCNPHYRGGFGAGFGGGWGRGMGRRRGGGGWGRGMGMGMGMGWYGPPVDAVPTQEILQERKRMLEEELKEIESLLAKEADA